MNKFLRVILFAVGLGLVAPNFIGTNINVNADDNTFEYSSQCFVKALTYDSAKQINRHLNNGYTLIKITDSKYPYFVLAKNCDNQIRIHSDFIKKEEKDN